MSIAARILPAFDYIMDGTRAHLSAIPDDRLTWRPHEKSWTVGELGSHLANLPSWTVATVQQNELDVAPADGPPPRQPAFESTADMLAAFDRNVAEARAVIEETSDETFMEHWTLLAGGEPRFSLPKVSVVQGFVLDHIIHHRGQLTVYLRLLDVPVAQTFGPTADFPDM